MSDRTVSQRPWRPIAYGVVALAIAFELLVVWWMLHPQVPADYRAYYIDETTTCLNQPVSGDYVLGTKVSFLSDGRALEATSVGRDGLSGLAAVLAETPIAWDVVCQTAGTVLDLDVDVLRARFRT